MPVTPFHLGPGLLLKAASPRGFSFLAYTASQVVIDVESGYHLLAGNWPVHRELHTFVLGGVVAALTGALVAVIGRRVIRTGLEVELAGRAAVVGGLAGGLMHSLLDGIMHEDIRPFRPFTAENPLYAALSLDLLHWGCVAAGVLGIVLLLARGRQRTRSSSVGR